MEAQWVYCSWSKKKNSKIDATACITFLLPPFLQGYLVTTVHDFFSFSFGECMIDLVSCIFYKLCVPHHMAPWPEESEPESNSFNIKLDLGYVLDRKVTKKTYLASPHVILMMIGRKVKVITTSVTVLLKIGIEAWRCRLKELHIQALHHNHNHYWF